MKRCHNIFGEKIITSEVHLISKIMFLEYFYELHNIESKKSQFTSSDAHLHMKNSQFVSLLFTEIIICIDLVGLVAAHYYESNEIYHV